MTMQRRVFDVDGRPHVVSRDGLYFETYATLAPVIADAPELPAPVPAPEVQAAPPAAPEPAPEPVVAAEPTAAAEPVAEAPAEASPELAEEGPRRTPRRRLARPEAEEAGAEPRRPVRRRVLTTEPTAEPAETTPVAEAAPSQTTLSLPLDDAGLNESAARRRARAVEAPRWQVAGALRRGRSPRI